MDQNTPATALQLDARVSFDDVVNIAVSRLETQLHTARTNVQNEMKLNQAKRAKLLTSMHQEIVAQAKKDHAHLNSTFGQLTVSVKVSTDENKLPKKGVIGVDLVISYGGANVTGYSTRRQTDLEIEYPVHPKLMMELDTFDENYTNLRTKLTSLNQQIQDIDRKTRQIKGLLAEQKLEAQGLSNLLDDPRIQNILQLQ
jgi:hypothetical protein